MKLSWNLPRKSNFFMLRVVGLWPDETYKFDFYTFYTTIVIVFFIGGHNFFQTANIFFINDLSLATAIIFVALSDLIALIKFYAVFSNMKTIKRLVNDINKEIFLPKSKLQEEVGNSSVKIWKHIFYLFSVMALATIFFWVFFPILDGTYKVYRLPFLAWYPYNYKKPFFYEITYVHQIIGIIYIATVNVTVDSLISALMTFIAVQCDVLCNKLRNLRSKDDVGNEFIECVKHHWEILSFAQDSNNFFNFIVLSQFFTSAVSVGLTMFQLTVIAPFTNEFYSFIMYGCAVIVEIFMYCWFGNEVQFKSSNIPIAAYEFDWTDVPTKLKKDLVFFIQKTQTPIMLSAFKLFYLSLETFTKIMRTAWSYFAVLHNINSSEESN